jgi:GT2 family glycosyltransferase
MIQLTEDTGLDGLVIVPASAIAAGSEAELQARFGLPVHRDIETLPSGTRAVLLLDPALQLPRRFKVVLRRALGSLQHTGPVAFPGNHAAILDPLAGLELGQLDPDLALGWASDWRGEPLLSPPPACLLLPVSTEGRVDLRPEQALLIDDGYVIDPRRPLPSNEAEDPDVPVLGHLGLRVRQLAAEGFEHLPDPDSTARGATLHITHGWGGGVWRWIEDLSAAEPERRHLVLVANSDGPGRVCGRYLSLCVAGPGRGVVRELPLAPRIRAGSVRHSGYADQLAAIIERFAVDRVIVSSPIGHSLDCLATGLPTAMVLHDFFPLWPLLDHDPMPLLEAAGGDPDRARTDALARHAGEWRLQPVDAAFWNELARQWLAMVESRSVRLVAPTRHVVERWRALAARPELAIEQVAHGFRPFAEGSVTPKRNAGRNSKLHLVIAGRLTEGKGLSLLREALPELAKLARITALGCGRPGLSLMGLSGIDLVPEYRRDQLPELLGQLTPDAALFCSTVPETWNYALSEMRGLGLAPIATAVGSFPERIRDGVDGWLFEPTPEALVECIRRLASNRPALQAAADAAAPERSIGEMAADFDRLLDEASVVAAQAGFQPMTGDGLVCARWAGLGAHALDRAAAVDAALDDAQRELAQRSRWAETMERQFRARSASLQAIGLDLERARSAHADLQQQFDERSRWAKTLERDLQDSRRAHTLLQQQFDERTDWAIQLDHELGETRDALVEVRLELDRRTEWAFQLKREIERIGADLELERRNRIELQHSLAQAEALRAELEARLTEIMHSRSWRMTRPLRVVKRVFTRQRMTRLLNPLRWPRMLTLVLHHLRLRGLRQTLEMLQETPPAVPEPATVRPVIAPGVEQLADPIAFAPVDQPEVSVIIPVYNQLHYTAHCLESLVRVDNRTSFEIVVVDDCSTDDTRAWLKRCRGIKVMRNRRNQGFIGTCNRGAEVARGRWLVFLNNDTRVTDGWLDALVQTFEQHPEAGVVGGRLVFADGSLQEAGGIVFRDGSGWNFGRGDDPDRPEYGFVSEADYVSGACLAISRQLFADLDGFDRHYAPAYYEDTDLCFRVRQRGLKVFYQPASTVIHFEGGTSGTDETAGVKRHQVVNRERFEARWSEVLRNFPKNPQQHSRSLERGFRYRRWPKRALVIDAVTPMPDQDSGSVRMFALLKLLGDLGYRTSFMPDNLSWAGRHSADLQQIGVEVLTAPWLSDPEDWLAEHGTGIDLLIVSRHYVLAPRLKLLRALCPNAKLVFDTVDLHFLREQREAELAGSEAARKAATATRKQELELIRATDATLVVSEFERELLAELTPDAEVGVVSNIHSLQDPGRPFAERRDLVFVGGFQHPPNVDAAEWLIDEILPRIRRELPEVELHLIGSKMPESLAQRRASGLRIHGFVADLNPYMTGCRVSVAPLRYGAGVKGKVNQAMSHGLPVVATSCAAEGMHTEHGVDVLMADDADSFAREVVRLYRDPELWQTLALGGRANVEQHFSVAAARRAVADVLERLELESGAD